MNFFKTNFDKTVEKLLVNFLSKIRYGKLTVQFPTGEERVFVGKEEDISANIKIHNYNFLNLIFKKGSVGFAEAYMNGYFSSTDLTNLLLLSHKNESYFLQSINTNLFFATFAKLKHFLNNNSKSQSKKNIKYHYDLGNNFYEKWLDKTMTYSSALFDNKNTNLSDAQFNKYRKIAETLSLDSNSKTLEIGCGWGGFSSFVAKNYNCSVDAITISKEQYEYASEKIQNEGLSEKVSVIFRDYRDIKKKYSNIVSIEMFEAVGKKYWHNYFDTIRNSLNDGGMAALQVITIDEQKAKDYQNRPDFIQQYIFPGGMLPTKKQFEYSAKHVGLKCIENLSFGDSYAKTLKMWNKQFQKSWNDLSQFGFDIKFKRMWEFYLSYCVTYFYFNHNKKKFIKISLLISVPGYFFDTLLVYFQIYDFETIAKLGTLPLWMIVLWFSFSTLFDEILTFFKSYKILGIILSGVLGPLTYYLGEPIGVIKIYNFQIFIISMVLFWMILMFYYLNYVIKNN